MEREMPWTILLFASGSLAIPAPSIFLVPPYPSSQDDPIYISCTAPEDFLGANFTLFQGGEVVQLLQAPSDQPGVTFSVTGSETAGGNFRCQFSVMGEHSQPQLSDHSQPVHVSFPVPTWIMVFSLSLAGAALFLTGLVAVAVVVVRKAKIRNLQKQRERESCWAQINFTNTDMSFDNSLFAISMKMTQEDLDEHQKRPTSTSSSAALPEFSTFRTCQ
ncbi:AB124611 [Phodopus roborovskii]|uniref:AB124611 protein n=1 Tax=Phodopus roborovskii TaxID=109678 RepID=A0AAU9ZTW0_PHORO|nr:AB124611 [Phodopus roborovskii]